MKKDYYHQEELSNIPNESIVMATSPTDDKYQKVFDRSLDARIFQTIVENASECIIINQDCKIRYANPQTLLITGYTHDELTSHSLIELVHPEDRQMFADHHQRTDDKETPDAYLMRIIDKQGNVLWVKSKDVSVDWCGRPATLNFLSTVASQLESERIQLKRELAEQSCADKAHLKSEERYRFLLENTAEGYYLVDFSTGRFLFGNQKVGDLFGYTMDEADRLTLWDVIHPSEHDRVQNGLENMMNGRTAHSSSHTYTCVRKDGSTFRGEISAKVDCFSGQHVIQGIVRDVTENERFLQRLQEIQKLETISTLAGGIAHDFNNILMAMQGNVSLLLVKMNTADVLYGKVKNIQQQIKNGAYLIRQLIGFARGGKYEAKILDINRLINETIRMFNPKKKKIELTTRFQSDIWMITADSGQIEQVLLNLYVNAWQAMPNGGQLVISTENRILDKSESRPFESSPGKYAKISITDSGIGMDAKTIKKIFDPFYTTKAPGDGTGLGLSSAYGIIKNHGGFINVSSKEGKGSTFYIYLPATETKIQIESDLTDMLMVGNETILLVDDEAMVLETGVEMLEEFGYSVYTADCGEDALQLLQENNSKIELVVLDLILPGLSGPETLKQMRRIKPGLKFLLASGQNGGGIIDKLPDCGSSVFIQKPFTGVELSQKIRQVLDG